MGIGGAETHVLTLARELKRLGHRVEAASSGGILAEELVKSGIPHTVLPLDRRDPLSVSVSRSGLLRLARGMRADIVHAHGRIPAFICGTLSRRAGFPPCVTTAHGFYDPVPPAGPLTFWGKRTVAVSEELAGWLALNYRLKSGSIDVIKNGVEITEQTAAGHGDGMFSVAAAMRLDRDNEKAAVSLIDAVFELKKLHPEKGIRLTLAGCGDAEADIRKHAQARSHAAAEGTVPDIVFAGGTAGTRMLLREADVFAGSSRSAVEAAAAGLPVILLSGSGDCGGILCEGNAGEAERSNLIPRASGASLLSSLSLLLEDDEARKAAGEFARRLAKENHDIKDTAAQTVRVYRRVADECRPGILLCGYFGARNAGDDATLAAAADRLREELPAAEIFAVARGGKKAPGIPEGTVPVNRLSPFSVRDAMKKSRMFVLCGGSLLQNRTSTRSLMYYSWLFGAAGRYGCRRMIRGGGIGPLDGEREKKTAAEIAASADAAGFRDRASLALAEELSRAAGAKKRNFYLSADAALLTRPEPLPEGTLPAGAAYIAVSARNLPGAGRRENHVLAKEIAAAVSETARCRPGCTAVWFTMSPEDRGVCAAGASASGGILLEGLTPGQIMTLAAGAEAVAAVRLHAALLAAAAGTPAVCVSYDPKVSSFAEEAGL
ncbi:MAG: glycosyltransferase, partial [Clostridia bacterium]|nr:glycosyltransferase [Clostridia bacterium]